MKRLLRALIFVYPRAWRERYGHEFEALLEDTNATWRQIPDIFLEAIKLRIDSVNWRFVGALATAGLVIATAISFGIHDRYISTATLHVDPGPTGDAALARKEILLSIRNVLSRTSLSNLIQSPSLELYKSERARMPLEDVIRDMKAKDLKITPDPAGDYRLEFRGATPEQAQIAVQLLANRLMDEHVNRQRSFTNLARDFQKDTGQTAQVPTGSSLDVQSPPSLDTSPFYPNRPIIALIGLILGLLAVPAFALIRKAPRAWLGASSAVLLCTGLVGFLPLPYESEAELVFDSPATLQTLTRVLPPEVVLVKDSQGTGLTLRLRNSDRFVAQHRVQTVISRMMDDSRRMRNGKSSPAWMISGPWAEVLDPPTLPIWPVGDAWRDRIAQASFALALFSAAVLWWEKRRARTTLLPA